MTTRYHLINDQGCTFDSTDCDCDREAVVWARGRGGTYRIVTAIDGPDMEREVASWTDGRRTHHQWEDYREVA